MQAIVTKFISCTNTKPARIVATTAGGHRYVISADGSEFSYGDVRTHARAAVELARKVGWSGKFIAGGTKFGWVFVSKDGDSFSL